MNTTTLSRMLRLLLAIVCTFSGLSAVADTEFTETVNGAKLKFTVMNNHPEYVDVNGFASDNTFSGVLGIPATITHNGTTYKIHNIDGFAGCTNITGVNISSVTRIDYQAFMDCTKLTFLKVSSFYYFNENAGLGQNSFKGCTSLSTVILPREMTGGGTYMFTRPFEDCPNLVDITVTDGDASRNNSFYAKDGVLFMNKTTNNQTTKSIVYYAEGRTALSYSIPSGVQDIYMYCFMNNQSLQSLTIPSTVKTLGNSMCYHCASLSSVNIPDGVKEIPFSSFNDCPALTTITLPSSLTTIGNYGFSHSGLTNITLPIKVTSIGISAFSNCQQLTKVISKNPTAPECGNGAFQFIVSNIDLTVPKGSDYGDKEPWKSMKSITYSDDILEKYGIRIKGIEVNEMNYTDVLGDGGKVRLLNDILYLKDLDISYSDNVPFIENYGIDDLYISVTGTCSIVTDHNYPLLLEKSTTIYGDTLTVSGTAGIVGWESVTLMNDVFVVSAINQLFFVRNLSIWGNTGFIGALGTSAKMGYIGSLSLGAGCDIVAMEEGHALAYDSEEGTILDKGEEVAGGTMFTIGVPFSVYFCGIHLTSATNYLTKDMFQVTPDIDGGYILTGILFGVTSDKPVLRTYAAGLELQLTGYSVVSASGEGISAISIDGNASFGGTGKLVVYSEDGAGIYIRQGWLYIEDIDIDIKGKTAGVAGLLKYGTQYWGTLMLNNVAGTIKATNAGAPALKDLKTLTLDGCYLVNASFDGTTHCVAAQEVEIRRNSAPTDISQSFTSGTTEGSTYYDLQGRRVTTPQPGQIYIVRDADGSTHKVVAQ